jgi:hypothetical protein
MAASGGPERLGVLVQAAKNQALVSIKPPAA